MTSNDSRSSDPFRPATSADDAATYPVASTAVRPKGSGGMVLNAVLGIALVVAVGGVAFGAGRVTAPVAAAAAGRNGAGGFVPGAGGPTASGAPGGGFGGGAASIQGTVTAVAADSITVQLPSGQSVTIPTTGTTTYHEQAAATPADVTSGTTVIVQLEGGRGGQGGQGGQGGGPAASGAPARNLGSASSVTVVPAGS
jgi:hypothetical protein